MTRVLIYDIDYSNINGMQTTHNNNKQSINRLNNPQQQSPFMFDL